MGSEIVSCYDRWLPNTGCYDTEQTTHSLYADELASSRRHYENKPIEIYWKFYHKKKKKKKKNENFQIKMLMF